ncbi:MAG: hypothetical protein RIR00_372, partial [Pseudomonadota bacterium]
MEFAPLLAEMERPEWVGQPQQWRLYQALKLAMLSGRLAAGERLPASRELAGAWGIARNSVLFAYQQLLAEGFLLADRRGTRVADLPAVSLPPPGRTEPETEGAMGLSRRGQQLGGLPGLDWLPFAPGIPDLHAFPWSRWARYLQQAWGEVSARQLAFAPPGGEPALRRALAAFLRARRGVVCTPEQVFIVGGAQMALEVCARLLADAGDGLWLENPGYPKARATFIAAGLRLRDLPVDQAGACIDAGPWASDPPRLLYLTPAHQYPLGSVLSLERRLACLARLRRGENWLIEDDYGSEYSHVRPGQRPLPALQGLQADAPVIYVGSFSQLLYPGLRLAYMVVPTWAAARLGSAIEGLYRSGQAVEQRALARFLEQGELTRHLRRMAPRYRERQSALRQALAQHFPDAPPAQGGDAGLHLLQPLPDGPADTRLAATAARFGIALRPLSHYAAPGTPASNGLILGYGLAEAGQIGALVARVAGMAGMGEAGAG